MRGSPVKNRKGKRKQILIRDGDRCFYCHQPMMNPTLEHLVGRAYGGTNDLHNLVLTHRRCNQFVGNGNLVDKLKLRDLLRTPIGQKIFSETVK